MNTPLHFEEALLSLIQHDDVTDICINGSHQIFRDIGQGLNPCPSTELDEAIIRQWVIHKLSDSGKSWDAKSPFIDFIWEPKLDKKCRIQVTFPPISPQGILLSIRVIKNHIRNNYWGSDPKFNFLKSRIILGESMVICGATGSGKTTLVNELLEHIPAHERIIALEDTQELRPNHPHFLSLLSRLPNNDGYGEVTLRQLLKQTLRMRPDRIILGECRGHEVLDFLQALNTGHKGALATLHSNSDREAIKRIELMCLLASNGALPLIAARELIAMGLNWIVHVQNILGKRVIHNICHIEGREGDMILLRPQSI